MAVWRHYHSVATQADEWTWDPAKDRRNLTKHALSPADGVPALADPFSATRADPYAQEERWQTIGRVGPSAARDPHRSGGAPGRAGDRPHHQREKGDQA